MATVLLTGAGGACGIGAISALHETTAHELVGVDMDSDAVGLYLADHGRVVPAATDADWGSEMAKIIDEFDVDVVVPTVDEELLELDMLPDGVPTVAPRGEVIEIALDKYRTYQQLSRAGHSVPETWMATEPAQIPSTAYPLLVKPRVGRGSRGIKRVETPEALERHLETTDRSPEELIVQEFIEGTEFTTSVVATKDNRLLGIVPKEAMEKDGSTVKGASRRQPAVEKACRELFETLQPAGPINVQQIVDEAGQPYTIEINPRFSSTSCLTVEAGVNEFDLLIRDALGETVEGPESYEPDVYFLRYANHLFLDETELQ